MSRLSAAVVAALVGTVGIEAGTGGWVGSAAADDEPGDAEPRLIGDPATAAAPPAGGLRGHHQGQFGLGLSLVSGARFITTYDSDRFCGERATVGDGGGNAAYCFGRIPMALDASLSYGLSPAIELMLDVRIGLERDFGTTAATTGPRLRHYAPGVRFFLGGKGQVNFFSTAQLAIDATDYQDLSGDSLGAEIKLRNANGMQVDFHDAYGVYLYFAEEVAFRRWLEVGVEFGAGIQARYP